LKNGFFITAGYYATTSDPLQEFVTEQEVPEMQKLN
jgi:hypothetical protein